jgi:hypothetical protein
MGRERDDVRMRFTHLRRPCAAVVTVAAMSLFAACGASGTSGTSPGRTSTDQTSAPVADVGAATAGVPELLDFAAPLVGGGEFRGAQAAGKPVAFWFWAPT